MAKLTRTQKYAGLRNDLANDKEANTASQDLSSYADRFNNIQETLAPESLRPVAPQPEYIYQQQARPVYNEPQQARYEYAQAPQQTYAQAQPTFVEPHLQQDFINPQVQVAPQVAQPVITPFEQVQVNQPFVAPFEQVQVKAEPVQAQPVNNNSMYFNQFMNAPTQAKKDDFTSFFSNDEPHNSDVDDIYKEVFNDVNDATKSAISRKERDTYLNQTISDVNFHNIINGEKSLNQIVDNAVNEVRHTEDIKPAFKEVEEIVDNSYAFENVPKQEDLLDADAVVNTVDEVVNSTSDEEFSNTVSMEITKIMDQMNAPAPAPVKVETPVVNTVIEEKPEDVVEIKNISEMKDEPMRNTVSGTIPFVVSTSEEEDIEEDEEAEGPNTILNIILIVLIIVLMAVLGLIIFYILKTKGIF